MKALVDGDLLVYRCGFAAEKRHYVISQEGEDAIDFDNAAERNEYTKALDSAGVEWTMETYRDVEDVSHALANVKTVMTGILEELKPVDHQVFLSQGKCFRDAIATIKEYKGNRKDEDKPTHYQAIRDYLVEHWGAHIVSSIEADDALALAQDEDSVIVSLDKDLLQVHGKHYNWVKNEKILITPDVGLRKLWMQVLTGDGTDNIPGIYRVGPVKARKLVNATPADEGALRNMASREWRSFLVETEFASKLTDSIEVDPTGTVKYMSWNGEECICTTDDVMEEVYNLVCVGGDKANEVLREAGETLLPA